MSNQDSSLRGTFLRAKTKQTDLETLDPRSEQFKRTLQDAVKALEDCKKIIDQIALFSTNEELEDVSTQDIQ